MLSYELRGTNRVKNQLRFLASLHPDKTDPIIRGHAKRQQRILRKTPYPSYLSHFKHKRKHFFGGVAGSFSAQQVKQGVWRVGNSRPYAAFVIGDPQKNHPSFLRWWKMKDITEDSTPELVRDLTDMLEDGLNRQTD